MALEWKWSEKCGTATFEQDLNGEKETYAVNLYVGNCFLIMIREFVKDGKEKYDIYSFFVSEEHMIRCMESGVLDGLVSIRINKAKCCNYKKIAALLIEHMNNIMIEVYEEGDYTWKDWRPACPVIPDIRMREIAEIAVSSLKNEEDFENFNAYADLTQEEMEYFGIYEEEE